MKAKIKVFNAEGYRHRDTWYSNHNHGLHTYTYNTESQGEYIAEVLGEQDILDDSPSARAIAEVAALHPGEVLVY